MPNHARTQADGVWIQGYVVPTADWEDLERKIFDSVNGDRGGAYAPHPNAGWTIGGDGLQVTGPVRLTRGGSITIQSGGAYKLRDDTWPEIADTHVEKTRELVQSTAVYFTPVPHLWTQNHPYGGIGSVACACRETSSRKVEQAEFYVSLRVVDGSTLKSVRVYFRVAQPRTAPPIAMPKVRVMRVPLDPTAGDPVPLKLTTDSTGYASPDLVTDPTAWYAEGAVQFFDYVCDQNNEIDVSAYHYILHVIDEQGAQTPDDPFDGIRFVERKPNVTAAGHTTSALTGSVSLDGSSINAAGERALVVDSDDTLLTGESDANSTQNGIYLYDGSAWPRAADCDSPDKFTPNWIVIVEVGNTNAGSVWQLDYPSSAQNIYPSPMNTAKAADASRIRIRRAEPRGNYYHSIVSSFLLDDLRFQ